MDGGTSTFVIVAIVIFFIILIVIGIIFFAGRGLANQINRNIIQTQSGTGVSTDNMNTGGNNLYLYNGNINLLLTILSNVNNIIGTNFYIRNNATNGSVIRVVAGTGVTFDPSMNSILGSGTNQGIRPGEIAHLTIVGSANNFFFLGKYGVNLAPFT